MNLKEDYHVHTNYNDHSDSNLTVKNVVIEAERKGIEIIALTEHVRESSEWIHNYLNDIANCKKKTKVKVIPGFEAKILSDGNIDCREDIARDYFIIASFHTKYYDKAIWINALKKVIENKYVNVIGHLAPESSFQINTEEIEEFAKLLSKHDKIVEVNAKYKRPPENWVKIFIKRGVRFHLGSDAHSLSEIGNYASIIKLIKLFA
ncbi:MAG TPA: PHP domain-containing protein [Nitrososphaeraceae archaeon]|jgi:histidinol phosphatase-like PHP family hydrolase|nr:PHP domain-containing protein [Nitrososphaeraceae archaeon]